MILAVVVGLLVSQLGLLLTTVYLHRCLSHRAVDLAPGVRFVCRSILWLTTGIKPRQWAAVHRRHHAYTDIEGDPHSPYVDGFARVQLANAVLYRRFAKDPETVRRYARDIQPDAWDRVLFDKAWLGLTVGVVGLCLALGWKEGLVAAAVHAVSYLLLNGAINAVGHTFGRQPFENTARNNQWLAWLTSGEGLHNNHHAAPTSARLSLAAHQSDPGWWVLAGLERLGWAKVRHRVPRVRAASPARVPA